MTEFDWIVSEDPVAMLRWLHQDFGKLQVTGYDVSPRKLRLFACGCCRLIWPFLADQRGRRAVEVAERHADGQAMEEEVVTALGAMRDGLCGGPPLEPRWSYHLLWETMRAIPVTAAREASRIALGELPGVVTSSRGRAAQAALLRDLIGNPWRPVLMRPCRSCGRESALAATCPECETVLPWLEWHGVESVCALSGAAYNERLSNGLLDQARLDVLADALAEAGCPDCDLLRHLRGQERCPECLGHGYVILIGDAWPHKCCRRCAGEKWVALRGPHARGCWALDLALGKD
jgi:hypothetical protein